jgi:phenylacetate-coenzyme A ligase PaaK-like adenylate-forming protein
MKKTPMEDWIIKRTGISRADQQELEAYQLKRVQEAVDYARKNSVFYQKQLAAWSGEAITSMAAFKKLPFTGPDDLKAANFDFLCVPQHQVDRIVTLNTSGTSGTKKRVFFTGGDLEKTIDFFDYGMRSLTGSSDRVLVLLPGQAYGTIGDLLKKALGRTGTVCHVYGILTDPEEVARLIDENCINCLVGIPIQILYLSRLKPGAFGKIEKVLLSTDYVPKVLVDELHRKFGTRVFNHYGMTEMGYGGGVECQVRDGYHLREGDLYFEIVNPHTGNPVPDGELGEVVFTTFGREAMPLIRYRTGDLAAFATTPCPCGTFLRTMKKVTGRRSNRQPIKANGVIDLSVLEELVLAFETVIDYGVTLLDQETLEIRVSVFGEGEKAALMAEITEKVQQDIHRTTGSLMAVQVIIDDELRPDQLVNSMIKRKIVIK